MASLKEGASPEKGKAGPWSYYQKNGKTIMRAAGNRRSDKGRTPKAMAARTRMGNVNNAWRAFAKALNGLFEHTRAGQNDYNVFMSANLLGASVFLTKEQAMRGDLVADNFCVSQGTLQPAIQVEQREEVFLSDIAFGPEPVDPNQPFYLFASNLVRYNKGALRFGDTLTFLRLTQRGGESVDPPYCLAHVTKIQLDSTDPRPLGQVIELAGGWDGFTLEEQRLCAHRAANSLVAWARTRKGDRGETLATTQRLVGENSMLERYTSWAQREEAIHSYGPLKEPQFFRPESYQPYEVEQYPELGHQGPKRYTIPSNPLPDELQ